MFDVKLPFFKTIILFAWFALIFLLVFGSGISLYYQISPYLILLSIIIILQNNGIFNDNSIINTLMLFVVLSFITSYHYFEFWNPRTSYLRYLCYSISGYVIAITSYIIIKYNKELIDIIYFVVIIFYIVGIIRFFRANSQLAFLHANTAYYYIIMPLPLLLLKSKQYIFHVVILIISFILCVISIKRGAIIAITILGCIYIYNTFRNNKKKFLYVLLLALIGSYVVSTEVQIPFLHESADRLDERLFSIKEDGGSGRDNIVETFFSQDIYDLMDIPEIFIGKGFEGTYNKYKDLSSLHNDFLEVTYSLGIIGLILLIKFFFKLFKNTLILIRNNSDLSISYVSLLFLFVFFGTIGCNFHYVYLSAPLFLSLGTLEALSYHNDIEYE